jgi:ribosomal protein L11 methyltransferase
MNYPKTTWELRVAFDSSLKTTKQIKARFMEWLSAHGIDEFVEGVMDGLDIDHEYTGPNERDFYAELGGELLPISVYKYNRELLEELKLKIERDFPEGVTVQLLAMETSEWLEGWKESFKPIETKMFYIYPPWETAKRPPHKIPLVIEPGMAFGTGQHATTQVVIQRLEKLVADRHDVGQWRCMDVGTGTGILALVAHKMGFKSVAGSDIDPDAVSAAVKNAELNNINLPVWQGSCPINGVNGRAEFKPTFDVVIANILFVVLQKIITDLGAITKPGGILILSGVLVEDAAEMTGLAQAQGLKLVDEGVLDGWSCLTFKKG